MIEGALIALGGTMLGFLLGRLRRAPKAVPGGAVCACGHNKSFHEPKKGCHHPVGFFREPCECRSYTGPEPMPEYYAPELPS